jgi:hypothetical protein
MSRKFVLPLATFAFAIANAFLCHAQVEQATVTGIVTDESSAAIAGAKVTLTNTETPPPG